MSELPREALAMGEIVAVVARDDGRARVLEGGVERGRKAGGRGMDHAQPRFGDGRALEALAAPVARAVVHRDHLEVAERLPPHRGERGREVGSGVADGKQHGDRGHGRQA